MRPGFTALADHRRLNRRLGGPDVNTWAHVEFRRNPTFPGWSAKLLDYAGTDYRGRIEGPNLRLLVWQTLQSKEFHCPIDIGLSRRGLAVEEPGRDREARRRAGFSLPRQV
jgi:hypothetical protein